ncbi:MAG: manganese transporter, partial [Gemmatimonadetes bacterium]|nr:manganese transporter [Gemmatimonadota bacterium]
MLWIFIFLCALGCDAPERDDGRIEVVCTTGMVADLARNIGGDRISVVGMMGPGVDPH